MSNNEELERLKESYDELKTNYDELSSYLKKVKADMSYLNNGGKIFIAVDTQEIISFILSKPLYQTGGNELSDVKRIVAETYVFFQREILKNGLFEASVLLPPYLYELTDLMEHYHNGALLISNINPDELKKYFYRKFSDNDLETIKNAYTLLKDDKNTNDNNTNKVIRDILKMLKEKFPEYYLLLTQSFATGVDIISKLLNEYRIEFVEKALALRHLTVKKFDKEIKKSYKQLEKTSTDVLDIKKEFERLRSEKERSNLYDSTAVYLACKFNEFYEKRVGSKEPGTKMKMVLFSDSTAMKKIDELPLKELANLLNNLHVRDSNYFIALLSILGRSVEDTIKRINKEVEYINKFNTIQVLFDGIKNGGTDLKTILEDFDRYKRHYEDYVSLRLIQHREELLTFYSELASDKYENEEKYKKDKFIKNVISLTEFLIAGKFKKQLSDNIDKEVQESECNMGELSAKLHAEIIKKRCELMAKKSPMSIYIDFRRFRNIPWGIEFEDKAAKNLLKNFNEAVEDLVSSDTKGHRDNVEKTLKGLFKYFEHLGDNNSAESSLIPVLIMFGLMQYKEALNILEYEKGRFKQLSSKDFFNYSLLKMLIAHKLMRKNAKEISTFVLSIHYYKMINETWKELIEQNKEAEKDPRVKNLITIAKFDAKYFKIDENVKTKELFKDLWKAFEEAEKREMKSLQIAILNNILFYTVKGYESPEIKEENKIKIVKDIEEKLGKIKKKIDELYKESKDIYMKTIYEIFDTFIRSEYLLYRLVFLSDPKKALKYLKETHNYCKDLEKIIGENHLSVSSGIENLMDNICSDINNAYNLFSY